MQTRTMDQLYPLANVGPNVGPRRREQVLRGIWDGKGVKEIAAGLRISPKTVEYHRERLYRVFGVRDSVSLCRRALKAGLLAPDVAASAKKGGGACHLPRLNASQSVLRLLYRNQGSKSLPGWSSERHDGL
jgi:DNA-binding CsgD family transcriptional regulator